MQLVCPTCGLPKELCVCEAISREAQKIRIEVEKKRFGKVVTKINGIDSKAVDVKKLTSELKTKLACGGTFKEGRIELQGNHKARVKDLLVERGFSADAIEL